MKIKITDLKMDNTEERGQIQQMGHNDVAKNVAGYQVLPQPGSLRVTAWEDSGMTPLGFVLKINNISSPCCAVVHDLRCRGLTLRCEWATRDRNMQEDSGRRGQRTGGLAKILLRCHSQVRNALKNRAQGCRIAASWQPVSDVDSAVQGVGQYLVVH